MALRVVFCTLRILVAALLQQLFALVLKQALLPVKLGACRHKLGAHHSKLPLLCGEPVNLFNK